MKCPGHARHWYAVYGSVGLRSPVCVRCGEPNPRPLTVDEWNEIVDWVAAYRVGERVRLAVERVTDDEGRFDLDRVGRGEVAL